MARLPRMSTGLAGAIAVLVLIGLLVSGLAGDGPDRAARSPDEVGVEAEAPEGARAATGPSDGTSDEAGGEGPGAGGAGRDLPGGPVAAVTRVVDGDTIHVARGGDETIRLIGIDTPEVDWYGGEAECFGDEAGMFARGLLAGQRVALEFDRERTDRYGRTLAYVYLEDGRMANEVLVKRGFATVTIYPPNDRYEGSLRTLEADARASRRGLWGQCG